MLPAIEEYISLHNFVGEGIIKDKKLSFFSHYSLEPVNLNDWEPVFLNGW
jgi:hypothetical protein